MSNQHLEITVIDIRWPELQIMINRNGNVRKVVAPYDIAASQFDPAVRDAVSLAVQEIIKSHKR